MKLVEGSYQAIMKVKGLSHETWRTMWADSVQETEGRIALCAMASAALLPGVWGHGIITIRNLKIARTQLDYGYIFKEIADSVGVYYTTFSKIERKKNRWYFKTWHHFYDIKDWDPELQKMGKGVAFSEDELKCLKELPDGMELLRII